MLNHGSSDTEKVIFSRGALTFLISVFLFYSLGHFLFPYLNDSSMSEALQRELSVFDYRDFRPEPGERNLYLIGLFSIPLCIFLLVKFFQRIQFAGRSLKFVDALLAGFLILYLWRLIPTLPSLNDSIATPFLILVSFTVFYRWGKRKLFTRILGVAATFLLLSLILYSFIDSADPYSENIHFQGVFYSMVQVHAGKTLLSDFKTAYGLYAHFLDPLFQIIPLSINSFSLLLGIMTSALFGGIWFFLHSELKNKILASVSWFTFLFYCYPNFLMFSEKIEPYFQYWPIRFLFPVLLILIGPKLLRTEKNREKWVFGLSYFFSFGILWNLDTGLVTFGTWTLIQIYSAVLWRKDDFKFLSATIILIKNALAVFLGFGTYWLLMKLFRDSSIDFQELIQSQKVFYGSGYYALPMPLFGIWTAVILIYTAGFCYSFTALFKPVEKLSSVEKNRSQIVLLLSILGAGLFSYYQNRSHDRVLYCCWYPAFLLLAVFTDVLFENFKNKKNQMIQNGILLITGSILFSGVGLVVDAFTKRDLSFLKKSEFIFKPRPSPLQESVDFIRANTTSHERITFFSIRAAEIFLLSETTFDCFPDFIDTFLLEDFKRLEACLTAPGARKVFIDETWGNGFGGTPESLRLSAYVLSSYSFVSMSPTGKVKLYVKSI